METLLNQAIKMGIIDLSDLQRQYNLMRKKEALEKHPYDIWCGTNGYWYTYLPDENGGRSQKKRRDREALEELIFQYWNKKETLITIEEAFNEWNTHRYTIGRVSKSTFDRNEQTFNRHYSEMKKLDIQLLDEDALSTFLEWEITKKDLTSKAFSNLKGITRGFLKRAKKLGYTTLDVTKALDDLDVSDRVFAKHIKESDEEVFDDYETRRIVTYLSENLDRKNAGLLLIFVTGVRIGELVCLKSEDFQNHTIRIRRTESRYRGEDGKYVYTVKETPKTSAGIRDVVLPKTYYWLEEYLCNREGFLFVNNRGKRMTTNCFRRRLARICKRLEITPKSPHKIRKTYGSILLDNHVDNRFIQDQMGHTDIRITERHYHRNRKDLETKIDILAAIPDFEAISRNQKQSS